MIIEIDENYFYDHFVPEETKNELSKEDIFKIFSFLNDKKHPIKSDNLSNWHTENSFEDLFKKYSKSILYVVFNKHSLSSPFDRLYVLELIKKEKFTEREKDFILKIFNDYWFIPCFVENKVYFNIEKKQIKDDEIEDYFMEWIYE